MKYTFLSDASPIIAFPGISVVRFVKIDVWIFLSCFMDLSKLSYGFVKIVTRISLSCHLNLLKLIHGFQLLHWFVKLLHIFPNLYQTMLRWRLTNILRLVAESTSAVELNQTLFVGSTNFPIHNWFQRLKLVDWLKELNKV